MSSPVRCVWFERVPKIARAYRRYSLSRECEYKPGVMSYCNAALPMDIVPLEGDIIGVQPMPPKDDPKWPTKCERCECDFTDTDHWQVFVDWVFKNTETGEEIKFRDLPVGAMYDAHWYTDDMRGPDGKALTVILPDHTPWCVDGAAHGNGVRKLHAWTRSGVPPKITASPSIVTTAYHGWLRDGVLYPC